MDLDHTHGHNAVLAFELLELPEGGIEHQERIELVLVQLRRVF
jgi:hypothetical protein